MRIISVAKAVGSTGHNGRVANSRTITKLTKIPNKKQRTAERRAMLIRQSRAAMLTAEAPNCL
jgi:hypothetical protein